MFSHSPKLYTTSILCKRKEKLHSFVNSSTHCYTVLLQNKREFDLGKEMKIFFIGSEQEYPLGITKILKMEGFSDIILDVACQ